MCGLAGIISRRLPSREAQALITEMTRRVSYRGPDDAGEWADPSSGVFFGHRRLAIIDLTATGHQPMEDQRRSAVIVYNGEIYNFRDLRHELEQHGHRFRSRSDTEVILEGYARWGIAVVERLRGMFAFALWDRGQKTLWLVRDRLAKKPLFYWEAPDRSVFLFASEIKSLLAYSAVERHLDQVGLSAFVRLGYTLPPRTMFAGIRKLPGGHWLERRADGQTRLERYWRIPQIGQDRRPRSVRKTAIRSTLEDAVRRRLVSDVPVGAFLSGGLDSTTTTAIMRSAVGQPIDTFSVSHAIGPRSVKYNVDARFARLAATTLQTNHRELVLEEHLNLIEGMEQVLRHLDEPYANYSYLSTFGLARLIKRSGVTVVLSGDGSDELFGGYPHYQLEFWIRWLRRTPAWLRRLLALSSTTFARAVEKSFVPERDAGMYFNWRRQLDLNLLVEPSLHPNFLEQVTAILQEAPTEHSVERLMYADLLLWIAEESNTRMDRLNMAASVESRAPFLDHRLVEEAANLPLADKLSPGATKILLREAVRDCVPEPILRRPKWGFFAPVHYWMRDRLPGFVKSVLTRETVNRAGVFRYEPIQKMLREQSNPYTLWTLTTFHLWYNTYIRETPRF